MEGKIEIALVISKIELDEDNRIFEYIVRMPDRSTETFRVRTGSINVGNKVEVGEIEAEEDGKKRFKIIKIV